MVNYDLFLEDGDLLEMVKFQEVYNQAILERASSLSNIDKSKLTDEDYVRELTRKIKSESEQNTENLKTELEVVSLLLTLSIVGIPFAALFLVLSNKIIKNKEKIKENDVKKLENTISKYILKLEKKYNSTKDEKEKEQLKSYIEKLENSKKAIYTKKKTVNVDEVSKKLLTILKNIVNKYKTHEDVRRNKAKLVCYIDSIYNDEIAFVLCEDDTEIILSVYKVLSMIEKDFKQDDYVKSICKPSDIDSGDGDEGMLWVQL